MKKKVFIILCFNALLLFLSCGLSCSKQKKVAIDERLIEVISHNQEYPSYSACLFFVKVDSDKILELDIRELREIYNENYSTWGYMKFVREALNQELIIKSNNNGKRFELNRDISNNYSANNFVDFMKLYCDSQNDNKYTLKYDILDDKLLTILYYAFANNYLAEYDDFLGVFIISKLSVYL